MAAYYPGLAFIGNTRDDFLHDGRGIDVPCLHNVVKGERASQASRTRGFRALVSLLSRTIWRVSLLGDIAHFAWNAETMEHPLSATALRVTSVMRGRVSSQMGEYNQDNRRKWTVSR